MDRTAAKNRIPPEEQSFDESRTHHVPCAFASVRTDGLRALQDIPTGAVAADASADEDRRTISLTRQRRKHGGAIRFGFGDVGINCREIARDRDERILELRRSTKETPQRGEAFSVIRADRLHDGRIDSVRTSDAPFLAANLIHAFIVTVWANLPLLYVKRDEIESGGMQLPSQRLVEKNPVRQHARLQPFRAEPRDNVEYLRMHQRLAAAERDGRDITRGVDDGQFRFQRIKRLHARLCRVVAVCTAAIASAQDVQHRVRHGLSIPGQAHHTTSSGESAKRWLSRASLRR